MKPSNEPTPVAFTQMPMTNAFSVGGVHFTIYQGGDSYIVLGVNGKAFFVGHAIEGGSMAFHAEPLVTTETLLGALAACDMLRAIESGDAKRADAIADLARIVQFKAGVADHE